MRRLLFVIAILLSLILSIAISQGHTSAFDPFGSACDDPAVNNQSEVCQTETTNPVSGPEGILVTTLNILSFVVGVAAILMIILGGLKYITSNGDNNAIANAKNTVLYAIVGLVVFLFSQVIIRFVISKL